MNEYNIVYKCKCGDKNTLVIKSDKKPSTDMICPICRIKIKEPKVINVSI